METLPSNTFYDPDGSTGTPVERPKDALGNALWDAFETVSGRKTGDSTPTDRGPSERPTGARGNTLWNSFETVSGRKTRNPSLMDRSPDDTPEGDLYTRVKKSGLTGTLADEFTRTIEANQALPGETGYGRHNLNNDFVTKLMYPHGSEDGNALSRKLFQDAPSAYSYLTGQEAPPVAFGTRVGVAYDQMAGKRAVAEGRDLGSLKNQLEVKERLNRGQKVLDDYRDTMADLENPTPQARDFFPAPLQDQYSTGMGEKGDAASKTQEMVNLPGVPGSDLYQNLSNKAQNAIKRVDNDIAANADQDLQDTYKVVQVGDKIYPWNEVYKGVDEVPNGNNVWEYNNQTGILSKNGEIVYKKGYSGKGPGLNNPEMVGIRNIGPTPNGIYEIVNREKRKGMGDSWALDETNPDFIEEIKRDPGTFYIHGDNKNGDRSASEGCIILPGKIRGKINDGDVIRIIS